MRKLASIQLISSIIPIAGKDRIALATVEGWTVIVQKSDYRVGDLCVYIEIDSVLPENPEFEFLRKNNFRIKTMKMAGCISQGICFPLSILPSEKVYCPGQDVTDILGVKQYEPTMDCEPTNAGNVQRMKKYPAFLMRMNWFRQMVYKNDHRGSKAFPDFISKTDETRIQNIPSVLTDKTPMVATEKCDGQSGSFCLVRHPAKFPFCKDDFEYIVCSRNLRLYNKDTSSYWSVSDKYGIANVLHNIIGDNPWVAIQGECIGPGIQKNKYKRSEYELYVFNVIYPDGRMDSLKAKALVNQYDMKFVPIVDENFILPDTVNEMLKIAHGDSTLCSGTTREGLVIRSKDGKQSFKAVDPLFLIKYDE